jgi:phosphatidylglycerol lysyltransferase-like protein
MIPAIESRVGFMRKRFERPAAAPLPGSGALEGLEVLDVSDLPRWKRAIERARSSGYACYLPFALAHQRAGRSTVLIAEDAGCLCVFIRRDRKRGSHLDLFLNPIPMDVGVARRCLDRANDFNHDRSARILRIDGNDVALAARVPGLRIRERRKQYVFAPHAFGDLAGGRYRTVRYHVRQVQRHENLEVIPYSERYAGECRALLDQWSERHRSAFGTSGDAGMSKRALALARLFAAPDLFGELILLGGRLVAFGFAGELRPGFGCLFEAKTDHAVPGLTHFQYYSFLSKMEAFERVNGGSDARSVGLGQLKDSMRPVAMHPEYRGSQVAS